MTAPARRPGRFGAVVTAMVTPFDAIGRVDIDGAVRLARHLSAEGSDGLVVTGTTGEGPTLTDAERTELWAAVVGAVAVPVIAGSTSNDTAHSVELTRAATATGVAGILAVTPYYNRPSQSGIAAHFAAVAAATALPVLVYDIPVRTGRKVALETMLQLVRECPNIVGVKDASADPVGAARLVARAGSGFELYSGDDAMTLPLLSVGAVGVVSVSSHWVGPELGEMIRRYLDGDVEGARALNAELIEPVSFQSSDETPNPLPTKAVLRVRGLPAGQCRLPMGPAPDWLDAKAGTMLAALDSWRAGRLARSGVASTHA
ncbi:MAG: 4-hydroxy-tetrahydrodipicolinate synthase [Acidimicrobiales bacterium]|jgi:4-hydroxy-tetrahydrodipicolinate synthase